MTLNNLYGYILAFILIAILLGIGLLTLSKINVENLEQLKDTKTVSFYENTTAVVGNTSYVSLSFATKYTCALATYSAYNTTGLVHIPANNYTISGCTIKAAGYNINWTDQIWTVNGTYTYDAAKEQEAYLSVNDTIKEVGGYSDYFGIIVIITIAALIIGLIVVSFVARRKGV